MTLQRRFLVAALTLCLVAPPALAQVAGLGPSQTDSGIAGRAYADLIGLFWRGSAAQGHFAMVSNTYTVNGDASEIPPYTDSAWQFAGVVNPVYAWWKLTASADALARLGAEWAFFQKTYPAASLSACGSVGGSTAVTLDDAVFAAIARLQFFDAVADQNALAQAKAIFDCARGRWEDSNLGGTSVWYGDVASATGATGAAGQATITMAAVPAACLNGNAQAYVVGDATNPSALAQTARIASATATTITLAANLAAPGVFAGDTLFCAPLIGKPFLNPVFALAETIYYQDQCGLGTSQCAAAAPYLADAQALASWTQANLQRNANPACSFSGPDALVWAGVWHPNLITPTPSNNACAIPNQIAPANSVVQLAYDMAWADLNARLYAVTTTANYLTEAQAIAASILAKHVAAGVFVDDRDARGNGIAAYYFAQDVLPLLTGAFASTATGLQSAYIATARASPAARAPDGGYSGDYDGPVQGAWYGAACAGCTFNHDRIEISGNTAIWLIMGWKWIAN